jgi:hypothetical protein
LDNKEVYLQDEDADSARNRFVFASFWSNLTDAIEFMPKNLYPRT